MAWARLWDRASRISFSLSENVAKATSFSILSSLSLKKKPHISAVQFTLVLTTGITLRYKCVSILLWSIKAFTQPTLTCPFYGFLILPHHHWSCKFCSSFLPSFFSHDNITSAHFDSSKITLAKRYNLPWEAQWHKELWCLLERCCSESQHQKKGFPIPSLLYYFATFGRLISHLGEVV